MITEILVEKITRFIKILRYIYKDLNHDIYQSLGKPFQKSVSSFIRLIPEDWLKGCLTFLEMLEGMSACIDYQKLSTVLHKNCACAWGRINSKAFVFDCMRGYCTNSINYEKAAENILENFNPIFNAVDFIFGHEIAFIDKVSQVAFELQVEDPLA